MAQREFDQKQQEALLKRGWFKLIDVLDDTIDMYNYGNQMFTNYPVHNSYVPVRYNILPKPEMTTNDEMSYRFNSVLPDGQAEPTRIDLTKQISPLKPFRTAPRAGSKPTHHFDEMKAKWRNDRSKSKTKRPH